MTSHIDAVSAFSLMTWSAGSKGSVPTLPPGLFFSPSLPPLRFSLAAAAAIAVERSTMVLTPSGCKTAYDGFGKANRARSHNKVTLNDDGAGKGARTPDLRMSQTFRGLSLSSRAFAGRPMSPTRHQLRHPGNGRFDRTAEYEYIHSSRPFG